MAGRQLTAEDSVIAVQQAHRLKHMFPGYPLSDLKQDAVLAILQHVPPKASPALVAHICRLRLIDQYRKQQKQPRLLFCGMIGLTRDLRLRYKVRSEGS